MATSSLGTNDDVISSFNDLFKEAHSVLDWFTLGLHLGVPIGKLRRIEHDPRLNSINRQQSEMLDCWLKIKEPPATWRDLGEALLKMSDYVYLGKSILQKYCKYIEPMINTSSACSTQQDDHQQQASSRPSIPKHLLPCPPSSIPTQPHSLLSRGANDFPSPHLLSRQPYPMLPPPYPSIPAHRPTPTPPMSLTSSPRHSSFYQVPSLPLYSSIRQGEMVVDTGNPPSISSAQSYESISMGPGRNMSRSIVACDRNGYQRQMPSENLLNFLPFNPAPNSIQSLTSSISSSQSQVVPNSLTSSQEQIAESELMHLSLDFTNLVIQARDALKEAKVQGEKLKKYLDDIFRGCKNFEPLKTLKTELSKIPRNPSVAEVFDVLLEFLNYDCPRILKLLIETFLPKSILVEKVNKYESDFRNFQNWCQMGTLSDAHRNVYPPTNHHYSDTTVAMHLNDSWQQQTYNQLDVLRDREFGPVEPPVSFRMIHSERRSILVVWETSYAVVEVLSIDCKQRFGHLRSQGVLQLLIGRNLLDYTVGSTHPKLYKLEVRTAIEEEFPPSASVMSLPSVCTNDTHWSDKTGGVSQVTRDSDYYSCDTASSYSSRPKQTPTKLPPYTVSDIQKCPLKKIQVGYDNESEEVNVLSVVKGELVRVTYEIDGWAEVVNSRKQQGYVPSYVLMDEGVASPSPFSFRHSMADYTGLITDGLCQNIVLHEVTKESCDQSCDQSCDDQITFQTLAFKEPVPIRPDTPPLIWKLEASKVSLSDDRNSMMEDSMTSLELTDEMDTRKRKRRQFKDFFKDIDSISLTKSLRSEWNRVKKENDSSKLNIFINRVKNFLPQRKISSATSISVSEAADLSPVDSKDWYIDLCDESNSRPCIV